VAFNIVELWMVYVLALFLGLVNAIDNPARQSFVFEMVGKNHLSNAVTLNSTVVAAARVAGPAVGGILIDFIGLAPCFFVNGFSFLGLLIALSLMRTKELFNVPRAKPARGQLREGFRYVWSTPLLRNSLIMMVIIGTFTYEYNVALPLFAKFTFNGGASAYAALTSVMGIGSIMAVFVVARIRQVSPRRLMMSALLLGVSTLLAAIMPSFYLALAALAAVGYFSANFVPQSNSILQLESAPEMRGRVLSLWSVAFLGSTPIGGPIIGLIGEYAGPRWALAVGGLAALFAVALGWRSLSRVKPAEEIKSAMELEGAEAMEKERSGLQPPRL
jgi:MFS family permease